MKIFQTIFCSLLGYFERCRKDFRRTSEVDQGRWRDAGKISDELRISDGEDGKMLKRFPTIFVYRPRKIENEGKISDEHVINERSRH